MPAFFAAALPTFLCFDEFLVECRKQIAQVVKDAYAKVRR
jgi:hypothetical protein